MTIQIDVKRSGFPVKFNDFELWFDASVENLSRFFDIQAEVDKRFNEYEKQILERSQNGEFDDLKDGIVNKKVADEALNLQLKQLEIKYDLVFGDGTFDKLYDRFPDFEALDLAFDQVDALIAQELEKMAVERQNKARERANLYKKKAKAKKK